MIGKCFINGKWIASESGRTFAVFNPVNGSEIGQVALASTADTQKAITAAADVFPKWSTQLPKYRATLLRNLYQIMLANREKISRTIVLEQGKSIHEARAEFDYSLEFVSWFAEEARRIYGEIIPPLKTGQHLLTIRQPIGVAAAITPWNFPLAMIVRKVMPALAAGCSIVVKPSEETPFTALRLAKLMQEAEIPDGVVNLVCGDAPAIGDALTSSTTVKMLSFTGSTKVGKLLMAKTANTVKKVALELGGNAPFIVFEDANLDKAVAGFVAAKLRNGGQSCTCPNRVYLHESIAQKFLGLLKSEFAKIKVGDGMDESTTIGTMINHMAVEKINSLLDDAQTNGSEIIFSGDIPNSENACFAKPTIIMNHKTNLQIERTEIFGPVASMFTFKSDEEVIQRANNTNYGLASYLYTENKNRIWQISEALEYGMVAVNDVTLSTEVTCFGGVKESGIGREGGKYGINEFLEEKFIMMS